MAFPFTNWFKSKPGAPTPEGGTENRTDTAPTPIPPLPQTPPAPSVTRTVTPNSVQPVRLHDTQATRAPITLPTGSPGVGAGGPARKISFGGAPEPSAQVAPPLAVRYQAPPPPSAAPEMTVSLELGDFLDRLPTNFLQPGQFDRSTRVDFLASELYSDLSRGRATVPASTIYQKCPQIFSRPISDTEDVEIYLPLNKLVEQLGPALHPRTDQIVEESVTEIETPFLQVAMEDNARLQKAPGTSMGATIRPMSAPVLPSSTPPKNFPVPAPAMMSTAIPAAASMPRAPHRTGQILPITPIKPPTSQLPPPTIAPPTAQSTGPIITGKRPPSTVRASVAGGKIRLSGPAVSSRSFTPGANPPSFSAPPTDVDAPATESNAPAAPQVNPLAPTGPAAASPSHQVTKKTARIQIPPISLRPAGSGAAGPRPPAPSAPSVQPSPVPIRQGPEPLTSFREVPPASPGVPAPPIFRSTPPPSAKPVPSSFAPLRPSFPPPAFPATPPNASAPGLAAASSPLANDNTADYVPETGGQQIEVGLAAILRAMPSPALAVTPSSVPDAVRISLPFGLIEQQLSHGRVLLPLSIFIRALPEPYRQVIAEDSGLTEVSIPLQEVFQNLPANALSRRADQIIEEVGNTYPTPFSQKAEEDAQRFAASQAVAPVEPAPVAEAAPVVESAPVVFQPEALALPTLPPETTEAAPVSIPASFVEEPVAASFVEEPVLPQETLSDVGTEEASAAEFPALETPPEELSPITNEPDADAPADARADAQPEPLAAIELPPIPASLAAESVPQAAQNQPVEAAETFAPFVDEQPASQPESIQTESVPEPVHDTIFTEQQPAAVEEPFVQEQQTQALELPPLVLTEPAAIAEEAVHFPSNELETEPNTAELPAASRPEETESAQEEFTPEAAASTQTEPAKETLPEILPVVSPTPELRDIPAPVAASAHKSDTALQTLFMTEDDLDAKSIVRLVNHLPGIEGCMIMFSDGLLLAGGFSNVDDTEGFSAMAPPFYQRTRNFTGELALGTLQAFTLYTDQGLTSFFMNDDICLSVRHGGRGFLPGVREKLSIVTQELAKMYGTAKPGSTH